MAEFMGAKRAVTILELQCENTRLPRAAVANILRC